MRISENSTPTKRWLIVVLYALAMGWFEAAAVYYLRTIVGRIDPYQAKPLPVVGGLSGAELVREAATLIMLVCVGWLAGRTWRSRFAYFLIAFGIWDIGYSVVLRAWTGWPRTLLDWDILFLLPLPWWGPVITPVLVATGMILFGTVSASNEPPRWPSGRSILVCGVGTVLVLWAFMFDAIRLVGRRASEEQIREFLPTSFPWLLFWIGLALMAIPVLETCLQRVRISGVQRTVMEGETNETVA